MNLTAEETDHLLNPDATDEQRRIALSVFRNRAALQRHREGERVRLAGGPAPAPTGLRVQLVSDGPVLTAPSTDLANIAQLDAWVRANVPGADALDPMQLRERSIAIRGALQSVGVKCSKRPAGAPVLLLSAWPGGNETERMLNMQRHAFPDLAGSPLDQQFLLTRENRARFSNRIV